jgi:hypothetical protein
VSEELLVYPTDKVVGVVEDAVRLDALRDDLSQAGVTSDQIEVLCGESGAERLDPGGEDSGPIASVIRTVQKALGEEATRLEQLNAAVESGAYVVQVALPEDGDEDEAKRRIGRILHEGGARNVAFYGSLAVEELQLGA